MDDSEQSGGLNTFVEQRRQILLEVRQTPEKRHRDRVESRRVAKAKMTRPSAETATNPGDLVLIKEVNRALSRSSTKRNLKHRQRTEPCKAGAVMQRAMSVEGKMEGRKTRDRRVPMSTINPFYVKRPNLCHPTMAEEFVQYVWKADSGLSEPQIAATSLYTLV